MKKEFQLTDEQLKNIIESGKPVMYLVANGSEPVSPQESANRAWQSLANEMGFVWDSVEGVKGKSNNYFLATPVEKVLQSEIEVEKYDSLPKIVEQLRKCNYECEGGVLINNVAFISLERMASLP